MKYGHFISRSTDTALQDIHNFKANIGDNVQGYAIRCLYKMMGIDDSDIVGITHTDMHDYNGEYVIVPFAEAFSNYKRMNIFPPSPKIIPVMMSMAMCEEECEDILPYLKEHQPIGCRDEVTMKLLRRKGIEAYLSGCLTITLPKRKHVPKDKKVFFVDIPNALEKYIPAHLQETAEYVSHAVEVQNYPMSDEDYEMLSDVAQKQFEKYEQEATLVVTSRLHAAAPCLAMGIPVIVAVNNIDYRFSWLDKFVPIYTPDSFDSIDWEPEAIDIEDVKQQIFELFSQQVREAMESRRKMYDLSAFYEERERVEYNSVLIHKLECIGERFSAKECFKYIIWGGGVHGKLAYSMMQEIYPEGECVYFVDKYMKGKILGISIISPDQLDKRMFDFLVITTHPGKKEALEKMEQLGKKERQDFILFMSKNEVGVN